MNEEYGLYGIAFVLGVFMERYEGFGRYALGMMGLVLLYVVARGFMLYDIRHSIMMTILLLVSYFLGGKAVKLT